MPRLPLIPAAARHAALVLMLAAPVGAADRYRVTLPPDAPPVERAGRLILFFILDDAHPRREPVDAPFFSDPQPIASIPTGPIAPGETIEIVRPLETPGGAATRRLDDLDGAIRVQAFLDVDDTERNRMAGPGNRWSAEVLENVRRDADDTVRLTLDSIVTVRPPRDAEGVRYVELESPMLSDVLGRPTVHRAGVVLPPGYDDPAQAERRWPTVYEIPGFGGTHRGASRRGRMIARNPDAALPVVTVVLDPENGLGHHAFVDNALHGPRGRALVEELIPHLEATFRLDARPAARIVTGHSSGGWSSLWLQLAWPEVFGACWSSAPDPVSFDAFQRTNIYTDDSMYVAPDGAPTPSYRRRGEVRMTVREEARMEWAIHPDGASGEQWDTWDAMFSPPDPATGLPARMFDRVTGVIDRDIVEQHWSAFDIAKRVDADWATLGPIMQERVRLVCGDADSYYLNEAVARLQAVIARRSADADADRAPGDGYIWLVPGADHGTVIGARRERWRNEMLAYLASIESAPAAAPTDH